MTYELLTGRLPFTGETAMSIAYKHLSGRVPKPSTAVANVPKELDGFVLSATDRDRELRPESATEMRRDLESIASGLPAARSLAAVVSDLPELNGDGAVTERVPLVASTTQTIPRAERTKRRRVRRFTGILLLLIALAATAWGAWTYLVPHHADVPKLVGTPVESARSQLDHAGFTVKIAAGVYRMRIPAGNVAQIRPVAGTTLAHGATVTLIPSLGPPPVDVPSVIGKTVEEATRIVRKSGLRLTPTMKYDETAPLGQIFDQDPRDGQLPHGEAIEVFVSKGPPPRPVPNVVGQTQADATDALHTAGFEVTVKTKFSPDIGRGTVIKQTPADTVKADFGSTVTITVSLGPKHFPAPDFRGLSRGSAQTLATQYGLQVTFVDAAAYPGTVVTNQSVPVGATLTYGDPITLYLV